MAAETKENKVIHLNPIKSVAFRPEHDHTEGTDCISDASTDVLEDCIAYHEPLQVSFADRDHIMPPLLEVDKKTTEKMDYHVRFASVHVRKYKQTVGDNPAVMYGPPIQLDWEYQQSEPIGVEEYEASRGRRRNMTQLVLSYYQRQNILTYVYGFSEEEVKRAKDEAKRVKMQRLVTKAFLPAMLVETAVESMGRKARRLLKQR